MFLKKNGFKITFLYRYFYLNYKMINQKYRQLFCQIPLPNTIAKNIAKALILVLQALYLYPTYLNIKLKGLAVTTNGAPRRGPGVRKVLFHRASSELQR